MTIKNFRFSTYGAFAFAVAVAILVLFYLLGGSLWQSDERLILYLAPDDNGMFQLARVSVQDEPVSEVWTDHAFGVRDYTLSPDKSQIVYTVPKEDGRSDLWLIDSHGREPRMILECPKAACRGPVWSPTLNQIIYERHEMLEISDVPALPRLWWLDPTQRVTEPLSGEDDWHGWGATFSPDGTWISLVVPFAEQVQAYNLMTGENFAVRSLTGEPAFWGGDGALYFSDVLPQGEAFAVHLFRFDLETREIVDISGDEDAAVNDGGVVWSSDGSLIAFNRKPSRAPSGKQLWLMDPSGDDQRSLTQEPDLHHGPPQWSADGNKLVYQTFRLTEPNIVPKIRVIDIATGQQSILADGIRPSWLDH